MSDEDYESNVREILNATYATLLQMHETLGNITNRSLDSVIEAINDNGEVAKYRLDEISKALTNGIGTKMDDIEYTLTSELQETNRSLVDMSESLDKVTVALDELKGAVVYGLLRLDQNLQQISFISIGCIVIGMLAILGTLRHWF
jgi:hypothetical protein